ncbi:hypothetical protein [Blastococcus xanthinilyticus]|uniref:hypothetical protein n=1 Tax=Blastococcus xanthinilyticus TaxID=1564164 RepID=UPI001411EF5E|nr:hypothetical protein [Blastococcus xanthinilyticus]
MFGWLRKNRGDEEPEIPGMVTPGRRRRRVVPDPAADQRGADDVIRTAMYQAVHDDAWLTGITDGDFIDDPAAWGELDPQACSAQLLRWFDAGLIEVHQDAEPADLADPVVDFDYDAADLPLIAPDAARALLADPRRWTDEHPDGFAVPVPTGLGRSTPAERWP